MKIYAIGGYNEVGRNMTALEIGNDVLILDCGLFIPPIVELEEKNQPYSEKKLRSIGALPDDLILDKLNLRNKVRAILISHAHLDHVAGVPFLASRYHADIFGTPFTIEVLKALLRDNNIRLKNKLKSIQPNSKIKLKHKNKKIEVEFINMTHSTLQTAMIIIHTEKGAIVYANDFKFDNYPVLGKKPNYQRLREIAEEGVKLLIVDSIYSEEERKTPSERIARDLLEDVMLTTENENKAIIATTFSSHIARLKSIVDFSLKLKRKPIFVGRSLNKYISAANRLGLVPFMDKIKLLSFTNQVKRGLAKINANRKKYLLVCTGHQGEPGSILDRLVRNLLPFKFQSGDHVIFSSCVIPTPINIANRKKIEKKLKEKGVRIFSDVHVSGHCMREDLRDLINMLNPEHIIPAHGDIKKLTPMAELASELGYRLGRDVHLLQNGQSLILN